MGKILLLLCAALLVTGCTLQNTEQTLEAEQTATSLQTIQGTWTSTDDANSTVEFIGRTKIDYYEDQAVTQAEFKLYELSPDSSTPQENDDGAHLVVGNGDDMFEYTIVELTDSILTLTYLARGNTLSYQR